MTSSINYLGIDQNFPVPGIDNDSQGFRDNFAIIKNNFESAKTDIEVLQTNTAKKNESNNFQNNDVSELNLQAFTRQYFDGGIVRIATGSVTSTVEWTNGSYQKFVLSRDPSVTSTPSALFTLGEWPSVENHAEMMLEFVSEVSGDSPNSVDVSFSVPGGGTLKLDTTLPTPFRVSGNTTYVVKCWSYDMGATVFVKYAGAFEG